MLQSRGQAVPTPTVFFIWLVTVASHLQAATETQNFDTELVAINSGWIGQGNRDFSNGTDFGFSDTNEAGGVSGAGEAGGYFPRNEAPTAFYADLSLGNFSLNDPLSASGRIVFHQENLDGGLRVGWFKFQDMADYEMFGDRIPAQVSMQIAEANRHQAVVILNDGTGSDAVLEAGGIGPISTPFSLEWDPVTRLVTATIGSVSNTTSTLLDEQMAIGADMNAFGLMSGFTGSSNSALRARLFIDDLSYTSGDTTAPQLRINRFSGATRIFGAGGTSSVELDGYTANSNFDNPPLEDIWIPANWNSITDQNGGTWSEVTSPTVPDTQQLSEVNLSGSITVNPGGSIQLGNVYDPSSFEDDITFTYGLAGEDFTRPGNVVFEGGLELRVNKDTGNITILNPEAVNIDIDGYVIQSASGELNDVGWSSLEDQTISGWEEIVSSSPTDLSEVNFTSSTMVGGGGGLLNLGAAYGGGLAGAEDLRFTYSLAGGVTVIEGMVHYGTGLLTGDYNNNGIVDAADYVVWQRAMATGATSLPNRDPSQSGPVDGDDYASWRAHFGQNSGSGAGGAAASVPEPAAWLVLLIGMAALYLPRSLRS